MKITMTKTLRKKNPPFLYDSRKIIRLNVSNMGRTCPKQPFKQRNNSISYYLVI